MNSSNVIIRAKFQNCKDLRKSIAKTISYIGDKKKADSSSIDAYNILNDYMNFTDIDSFLDEQSESFTWSMNGDVDAKKDLKEITELDSKGLLWSLVISFPPEFAINNGLITKSDYYQLTTNIMPIFLTGMGLKLDNVTWYCSLHRNTKNPHLHINFFEHKKTIKDPKIPYSCIYTLKSNIANYLIDNEKFYRLRDEKFKSITGDINLKELTKVKGQKLYSDKYRKELNIKLLNLYSKLPKRGRLQYNSQNMDLYRDEIDSIIRYILMHDSVKYDYAKYLKLLDEHQKEMIAMYGNSKTNNYYDNQLNKLYSKIGNEILTNFKIYNSINAIEKEKVFLKKHIHELGFKSRNDYAKETSKADIAKGLYKICQMADLNYNQTKKIFKNWLDKSNYDFNLEDIISSSSSLTSEMSTSEYHSIMNKLGYNHERLSKIKSKYFYQELNYKKFINRAVNHLMHELEEEEKQIINEIEYELDLN